MASTHRDQAALTSLEAVRSALADLTPPQAGWVRVYRGQIRDYGSMRPAAMRQPHPDRHLFSRQAFSLARGLLDREANQAPVGDLPLWLLWVEAVAQHYGPGSRFLDVTWSPEIALWFALHAAKAHQLLNIMGDPGPLDPEQDQIARLQTLSFEAIEDVGLLYAFDVQEYSGSGKPDHGALIDLATAPPVFAASPRLHAQSACLLAADANSDGGDLSGFQVGAPIPVGWPMTGSSCGILTTQDLFPPPGIDSWYDRLVTLPLVNRYDTASHELVLKQPLPVTLYGGDQNALHEVGHRVISLPPNLLWPHLLQEAPQEGRLREGFKPDPGSTSILLELPAYKLMPPLDGGWNHGIVASDIPDEATVVDDQNRDIGRACLSKTFFEFSPLELDDWRDVEATSADTHQYVRGAYLERLPGFFSLWIIEQAFPSCKITVTGPYEFALDTARRHLVVAGGAAALPLASAPIPGKVLVTLLTLLRELSSAPVSSPFPEWRAEDHGPAVIRVQGNRTVALLRVGDVHVLRDRRRWAAFAGTNTSLRIAIADAANWEALDPTVVHDAVVDVVN